MHGFRLLAFLLFLPLPVFADADRRDWVGSYEMNHDGHLGTLRITPSRRVCPAGTCAGLDVFYTDDQGSSFPARVSSLDDTGQHMAFTINFGASPQPFDVYLFSTDKSRLAGTTVWNGRTFGVIAVKGGTPEVPNGREARRASNREAAVALGTLIGAMAHSTTPASQVASAPAATNTPAQAHTLSPDGTIEVHKPDGSVLTKRLGVCGGSLRLPSGKVIRTNCTMLAAVPVIPPDPPASSPQYGWLKGQDEELLQIIGGLLGGTDSSNYRNYIKNYETPADAVLYKRIYYRTKAIAELASPQ